MLIILYIFLLRFIFHIHYAHGDDTTGNKTKYNLTRRIIRGNEAGETRPYMVYLRPSTKIKNKSIDSSWTCGGAIIHPFYILTSAACIEDVEHFYVISGINRWIPLNENNECIKNGANKAIWKCVPKDYVFDGKQYENIHWMINDIAVVKVADEFNFSKRVRGCDFIPRMIGFNNRSKDLEAPNQLASTAGWGATDSFSEPMFPRGNENSRALLETEVVLMSLKNCKKLWAEQYHYVIDQSMICGNDGTGSDGMSEACKENEVKCKELVFSEEDNSRRRLVLNPDYLKVHGPVHFNENRRKTISGGFCENDHGGPLVLGHGTGAIVIGVISACMTAEITKRCQGPFLYTSVWLHRHLISCAIDKNRGTTCKQLLRSGKPYMTKKVFDWEKIDSSTVTQTSRTRKILTEGRSTQPKYKISHSAVRIGTKPKKRRHSRYQQRMYSFRY